MNFKLKKLKWNEVENDTHIFKFYSSSIDDILFYEICYCGSFCNKNEAYQSSYKKGCHLFSIGSYSSLEEAKEICQKHADKIRSNYINNFLEAEYEENKNETIYKNITEEDRAEMIKEKVKFITEQKMLEYSKNISSIEETNRTSSIFGVRTSA